MSLPAHHLPATPNAQPPAAAILLHKMRQELARGLASRPMPLWFALGSATYAKPTVAKPNRHHARCVDRTSFLNAIRFERTKSNSKIPNDRVINVYERIEWLHPGILSA